MSKTKSYAAREAELLTAAKAAAKAAKYWTDLSNAVYGIGGIASRLLRTRAERERFTRSAAHRQIRDLIEALPEGPATAAKRRDASGKVLVRLPKSVHAALQAEAQAENISLNQLILAKVSMQLRVMA